MTDMFYPEISWLKSEYGWIYVTFLCSFQISQEEFDEQFDAEDRENSCECSQWSVVSYYTTPEVIHSELLNCRLVSDDPQSQACGVQTATEIDKPTP